MPAKKPAKKPAAKLTPCLITTEYRGVFFGYVDPKRVNDDVLLVERCRLCSYWSTDMRGFLGLATMGPDAKCRVSRVGASVRLRKITSVTSVEPDAVARWEASPWG